MTVHNNPEGQKRLLRMIELTERWFAEMTDAEKDRLMQINMAQARGKMKNLQLAVEMSDALIQMKRAKNEGAHNG